MNCELRRYAYAGIRQKNILVCQKKDAVFTGYVRFFALISASIQAPYISMERCRATAFMHHKVRCVDIVNP